MNIIDYSIKVKNLADALASIKAFIDDEDLMDLKNTIASSILQL